MKKIKGTLAAGMLGLAAITIDHSAIAQPLGLKRTELLRHDLSIPGREVIQAAIEFKPGDLGGRHKHPGEEMVYVLEGVIEYKVEGKPAVTLRAGQALFIPAETVHSAKNVGSGKATELATYVVDKAKPLITIVK